MARTVKVGLLLEALQYIRGARESARATNLVEDAVDDLAGAGAKASKETDRLGGELSDLARDARRLDGQIDETTRGIRDLARQIAATSDAAERAKLADKLKVERVKQRELVDLRKLVDVDSATDMGAELASKVSMSFGARIGPMLARVPFSGGAAAAPVAAIGAPIAAGLVSLLSTAVGGAIIGGVGIGGVIGGVTLASKHPAVKAAGSALGDDLSAILGRSSAAFVPETLGAISKVRDRVRGMEGDFERAFGGAARLVDPLVDGLLEAAEGAMPGIIDAIDAAGPVIDAVAEGVGDLGKAIGEGLSELAPYADEGARALRLLFATLEFGVHAVFEFVEGMAQVYKVAELVGAIMTGNIPKFFELATSEDRAKAASEGLAGHLPKVSGGIAGTGTAAAEATPKIQTWAEFLEESLTRAFEGENANIRLEEAIDRVGEAAKNGAEKGIDPATEAGRKNRLALLGVAEAANASHDAILESTGSQELATEAKEKGRIAFLKAAESMGVEAGEAKNLANKLFGIPKEVKSDVKANTGPARAAVQSYKAWLASVYLDKTSTIYQRVIREESTARGGDREFNRWGGLYSASGVRYMADGGVLDAHITRRPMVIYGERETGGEAFVPRNGDPRRSLAILDKAAAWYGASLYPQVVPQMMARPAAGGGMTVVNRSLHVTVQVPPTVNKAEVGREVASVLDDWARANGRRWQEPA